MSSSSQQHSTKPSHGGNNMAEEKPLYMLDQYVNADATIVERISGAAKGVQSSKARYEEYTSKARRDFENFDKAWGGK
ncbi:hypothetical protein CHU98_g6366 [Xylaria longipes]|nr:hypothetical protein CHU98_g6366 [Xylaria longipes]